MKYAVAMVLVAMCAPAAAQGPEDVRGQEPTFRTGVDLIAVDVAVVDSRGRPVEDLRAPEFSVRIDGEPRRVVSAELVKVNIEDAKRQADDATESFYTSNLTPPNARQIVIAVDQMNIHPASIKPLMAAASRFLERLSPLDQVAFVAYPEPGPRISFTTDRLRIRLAMEGLIGHPQAISASQLNIGVAEALVIEAKRDQLVLAEVVGRECSREPQLRAQCERDIIVESSRIAQTLQQNADASLDSLRDLLERLAYVDGPKSLILISEGLAVDEQRDIPPIVTLAGRARTSINVMLVDLSRGDITISQLPATDAQDRRIQVQGLEALAVRSRGSLFRIVGTGDEIFDRLASEISAYYLLGVEQRPGDDRAERRRIDVEVRRRDVTIRSRQAFVLSPTLEPRRRSADEHLRDALLSPFGVSGVPLRVTTFAQQDPGSGKVQLTIAAQIGAPGTAPGDYEVGYLLVDNENRVAGSFARTQRLAPLAGSATEPLAFVGGLTVDPGVYTLRFGVVDAQGRRGSVVRDVSAWKMMGEEFASGDLFVGNLPRQGEPLHASVEPHVTAEAVAMYIELYSTSDRTWSGANVTFEVADDADAPALAATPVRLAPGRQPTWRTASGAVGAAALPPGKYVARARITRDGKLIGVLTRPFAVDRASGARTPAPAAVAAAAAAFASTLPAFDRQSALSADVLAVMLDLTERRAPALKEAIAEARAGRYGPAALDALSEGDQTTAAFLRGLEFFVKGDLDAAATQLDIASGPRREFFPAAFYLGAVFATAGRDRDAAGIWQLSLGSEARPAVVYPMIADARMRDGQPESAIEILKPAHERAPADDAIARRLGMAYVLTARYAEAVPVLESYLSRHASDQDALLGAIVAQYELAQSGQAPSNIDRARLRRYAAAYRGEHQALVEKYLETMQVR